jgi:hypothetical protein
LRPPWWSPFSLGRLKRWALFIGLASTVDLLARHPVSLPLWLVLALLLGPEEALTGWIAESLLLGRPIGGPLTVWVYVCGWAYWHCRRPRPWWALASLGTAVVQGSVLYLAAVPLGLLLARLLPRRLRFPVEGAFAPRPWQPNGLLHPANLARLQCDPPAPAHRFVAGSAPGNLFLPHEPVTLTLATRLARVDVEVLRIGTQTRATVGPHWLGTAMEPQVEVLGPVVAESLAVQSGRVHVPVPADPGCYVVTLRLEGRRCFLCTVARVSPASPGPILADGQLLTHEARPTRHRLGQSAQALRRLGIDRVRMELPWPEQIPNRFDWPRIDPVMNALEDAGIRALITLGRHPDWTLPFGTPTPAVLVEHPDLACAPHFCGYFGRFVRALRRRYRGLWGLELWGEPWEATSTAGWHADSRHYRTLFDTLSKAAGHVPTAAASAIMNTEDKFFTGDDRAEWAQRIGWLTDHYVHPASCYGPRVAAQWQRQSVDVESWLATSQLALPQIACQWLACGQAAVSPCHPSMLFFDVPGSALMPTPVAVAVNAFNRLVGPRPFMRILFDSHLPWAFQFGTERDAVVVLLGRLLPTRPGGERDVPWWQVNLEEGGWIHLDGDLQVWDVEGRPVDDRRLPFDHRSWYLTSRQGASHVRAVLQKSHLEGVRPVELLPQLDSVTVHNLLNRALKGRLRVNGQAVSEEVHLGPGERQSLSCQGHGLLQFDAATWTEPVAMLALPATIRLADAELRLHWDDHFLHLEASVPGPMPQRHPRLERWDEDAYFYSQADDALCELLRPCADDVRAGRPSEALGRLVATHPEVRTVLRSGAAALYLSRRISFADARHVYRWPPQGASPWWPDSLQIGLRPPGEPVSYHGLAAVSDTVFEYALYPCDDGGSELWCLLAPGMPRGHHHPRQPRARIDQGVVPGGRHRVRHGNGVLSYELALPWPWKPAVGQRFCGIVRFNRSTGPPLTLGSDSGTTRGNGLSLHPYWEVGPSCNLYWVLR